MRDSIAFVRSLRRVCLAVPRAVIMSGVMASSVDVTFTLACLASLGYTLACMPTCLLDNSTIILSLMIVMS